MKDNSKLIEAAKLVVPGAICGDIIGSAYEFHPTKDPGFTLLTPKSRFTDDTVCTIALADTLNSELHQRRLRRYFYQVDTVGQHKSLQQLGQRLRHARECCRRILPLTR